MDTSAEDSKVKLYNDTLFKFTLNVLDSIIGASEIETQIKFNLNTKQMILFALKDFEDTLILKEFPGLRPHYLERSLQDLPNDKDTILIAPYFFPVIDTNCCPEFHFVDFDQLDRWREWRRSKNIGTINMIPRRYLLFSKPIISSDRRYIAIEVHDNCYGLCGSGSTYVLERKANKWSIVLHRTLWIS